MDLELIDKVKKITIITLVSDDYLMDKLVLKGGNAINVIYNLSHRASIDLDYSIQDDFEKEELENIKDKIERLLKDSFEKEGYKLFDYEFYYKPKKMHKKTQSFWGSYNIDFKLIPLSQYAELKQDTEALRRNSLVLGSRNKKKYTVEISKFEFCEGKQPTDIEGYTLYVYTPEMIVIEKLRAICQQVPEYKKIVKTMTSKSRAEDFFDIYVLSEHFNINLNTKENIDLLRNIFEAKKVPLEYLGRIGETKAQHKESFIKVQETTSSKEPLKNFDFYFEYVVNLAKNINL